MGRCSICCLLAPLARFPLPPRSASFVIFCPLAPSGPPAMAILFCGVISYGISDTRVRAVNVILKHRNKCYLHGTGMQIPGLQYYFRKSKKKPGEHADEIFIILPRMPNAKHIMQDQINVFGSWKARGAKTNPSCRQRA